MGKFCHACGQENIEPKESIWYLVSHFINDVTHFDGKFFSSLKYLITRPGFLSKEYMIGKRASYLNPIRMYLFTSAIFFVVFFSILNNNIIKIDNVSNKDILNSTDSTPFKKRVNGIDRETGASDALKRSDSLRGIYSSNLSFKSKREYDSLLKSGARNDNWLTRKFFYKLLEIKDKYQSKNDPDIFDSKSFTKDLVEKFNHTLPQMLFVLLPIFALILKLLYRKKQDYYYTDHFIFTLHLYIFIFIVILAVSVIDKIAVVTHWNWFRYISAGLMIAGFFYFYKSLRNFYKQRRAKTILKFFIILFLVLFIFLILFASFFFLSLFQI